MIDTIKSTNSIECCEAGMQKTGFQGSSRILKKSKVQILAPQDKGDNEAAGIPDKFDDLPDSIILHILSFMETKDAIQTCVLSKRWRYVWTSIPHLNFSSKSFTRLVDFKKFVLWVLSRRDSSHIKVLNYYRFGVDYATDQHLLNKVIEYATSHGVEEITVSLRAKAAGSPPVEIPMALFNCQSLKRLELKDCHPTNVSLPLGCKSLENLHLEHFAVHPVVADFSSSFVSLGHLFGFTTLTTLHLSSLTLCCTGTDSLDPFEKCVNLKNLHLSEMCFKSIPKDFVISAPKLNNLTLMCNRFKCRVVVAAPKLINFSYLYSTMYASLEFSIPSLDDLNIDICEPRDQLDKCHWKEREKNSHGLINMFQGNHDAELSFCTAVVRIRSVCVCINRFIVLNWFL